MLFGIAALRLVDGNTCRLAFVILKYAVDEMCLRSAVRECRTGIFAFIAGKNTIADCDYMRHVDIDGPEFGSFCSSIISVFKSESLDKALLRVFRRPCRCRCGHRLGL